MNNNMMHYFKMTQSIKKRKINNLDVANALAKSEIWL